MGEQAYCTLSAVNPYRAPYGVANGIIYCWQLVTPLIYLQNSHGRLPRQNGANRTERQQSIFSRRPNFFSADSEGFAEYIQHRSAFSPNHRRRRRSCQSLLLCHLRHSKKKGCYMTCIRIYGHEQNVRLTKNIESLFLLVNSAQLP